MPRLPYTSKVFVSTHSRLKAAGREASHLSPASRCFNTQPPEGGWGRQHEPSTDQGSFNTQPPEGGWVNDKLDRKADKCFNTQPPEGGWSAFGVWRYG